MIDKDELRDLPANFGCPYCKTQLLYDQAIQNKRPEHKKGDLIICSCCGNVGKVGVFALEKVTPSELEALDPQSKMMLAKARASVMVNR